MKDIPKQVRQAANGLGTEIVFEHKQDGYDVYSVGTPHKEGEIIPPTGYPKLILFKDNSARIVTGSESLDWL